MPLTTKIIKQKIKSVGNIKKITQTMEMVSVSKMRFAVDKAITSKTYSRYALELLVNLSKDNEVNHPLMIVKRKSDRELVILMASNKGLCGGYHANLHKALLAYLKKNPQAVLEAVTLGKYAEKICKKSGLKIFASFNNFSEHFSISEIEELSNLVKKEFIAGQYKSVKILYTEFIKSTTYKPILRELFPISVESLKNIVEDRKEPVAAEALSGMETDGEPATNFSNYVFEPSVSVILESILPGLIDAVIYQALAEAFASEHSARMFAMKNAGDNATSILDSLMLSYNHARQDGITRELSEIIAGAEALSSH